MPKLWPEITPFQSCEQSIYNCLIEEKLHEKSSKEQTVRKTHLTWDSLFLHIGDSSGNSAPRNQPTPRWIIQEDRIQPAGWASFFDKMQIPPSPWKTATAFWTFTYVARARQRASWSSMCCNYRKEAQIILTLWYLLVMVMLGSTY